MRNPLVILLAGGILLSGMLAPGYAKGPKYFKEQEKYQKKLDKGYEKDLKDQAKIQKKIYKDQLKDKHKYFKVK